MRFDSYDDLERHVLDQVALAHPRPTGRLTPDEHARLMAWRLHGRLDDLIARLLAADDGRPLPGPTSIAV